MGTHTPPSKSPNVVIHNYYFPFHLAEKETKPALDHTLFRFPRHLSVILFYRHRSNSLFRQYPPLCL